MQTRVRTRCKLTVLYSTSDRDKIHSGAPQAVWVEVMWEETKCRWHKIAWWREETLKNDHTQTLQHASWSVSAVNPGTAFDLISWSLSSQHKAYSVIQTKTKKKQKSVSCFNKFTFFSLNIHSTTCVLSISLCFAVDLSFSIQMCICSSLAPSGAQKHNCNKTII